MKPILAGSALVLGWLAWRSLGWPLIHDAPLMHYVAWLVVEGAVPYRDVFDMNLPGAYLVHAATLVAAGPGDLAWRLVDLTWLAVTCALVFACGARLADRWAGLAVAVLFGLYHVAGGAWRVGQRDFLLCVFLLAGAHGTARFLERGGARAPLVWAGLLLGAGVTLKPYAGAFWLACAAAAALAARRLGRAPLSAAALVVGGGLVAPALVFGWLTWRGGSPAFVDILTGYVIPLYSRAGDALIWQAMAWYQYGWALFVLLGLLALLGALAPVPARLRFRRALAVTGVAYGVLHFAAQRKGWEYHLYPFAAFLCVLAAAGLARPAAESAASRGNVRRVVRPLALATLVGAVGVLGAKGVDAIEPPWIAAKVRRVAGVVRDLAPLVPPGGTVQVLDTSEGGVHALLRLGLRQPTRYLYDFHFFHDVTDPRIQRLRREFAEALRARPPAAVVVFRDTWRRPGYDRLGEFPALAEILVRQYALAIDRGDYRIYAKRSDP
ncbi:MAG TPA: glycosyltransferase family 39 protein [Candidatus Binatia bacterium]|nr:glycosyltransferase family 39 protein [Candidatus Binatia bacterium]